MTIFRRSIIFPTVLLWISLTSVLFSNVNYHNHAQLVDGVSGSKMPLLAHLDVCFGFSDWPISARSFNGVRIDPVPSPFGQELPVKATEESQTFPLNFKSFHPRPGIFQYRPSICSIYRGRVRPRLHFTTLCS